VTIVSVSCVLFFNTLHAINDLNVPVCMPSPQDQTDIGVLTKVGDNRSDIGREAMSLSLPRKGGKHASFCEMGHVAAEENGKAVRFRTRYRIANEVTGKAGDTAL
jgi:hypothetical protein